MDLRLKLLCGVVLAASLAATGPARSEAVTIFAAASLTDAIEMLADAFEKQTGHAVEIVPGASSSLARQVLAGAPADLFISADAANAKIVAEATGGAAYELFGNRLAIIAPDGFEGELRLEQLPEMLGGGRLAIGDPAHVPAGIYARQALENAGLWDALADRLAPAGDVRSAVAFVARGAAPFGIAYATDAAIEGVRVAGEIDPSLHAPVRYWGVVVDGDNAAADMFLSYVGSFDAQNRLDHIGFKTVTSLDK